MIPVSFVGKSKPPPETCEAYLHFEKEGPFKKGDEVTIVVGTIGVFRVRKFDNIKNAPCVRLKTCAVLHANGERQSQLAGSSSIPMLFFDSPFAEIKWDTLKSSDHVEIGLIIDEAIEKINFKVRGDGLKVDGITPDKNDEDEAYNFTTTGVAP